MIDSDDSSSDEEYAEYNQQSYNPMSSVPQWGEESNPSNDPFSSEVSNQWGEEAQSNNPFGDSSSAPAQNTPQQGFDMFSEPS